jgi:hypothetical protein
MYIHPVHEVELAHQRYADQIRKAQQFHQYRLLCEARSQSQQPLLYRVGELLVTLGEWMKRRNRWPVTNSQSAYQV